jgi:hypothetical protein
VNKFVWRSEGAGGPPSTCSPSIAGALSAGCLSRTTSEGRLVGGPSSRNLTLIWAADTAKVPVRSFASGFTEGDEARCELKFCAGRLGRDSDDSASDESRNSGVVVQEDAIMME